MQVFIVRKRKIREIRYGNCRLWQALFFQKEDAGMQGQSISGHFDAAQ